MHDFCEDGAQDTAKWPELEKGLWWRWLESSCLLFGTGLCQNGLGLDSWPRGGSGFGDYHCMQKGWYQGPHSQVLCCCLFTGIAASLDSKHVMSGTGPDLSPVFHSLCCRVGTQSTEKPVCEIFQWSLLKENMKEKSIRLLCYLSLSFACYCLHIAFGPWRTAIALYMHLYPSPSIDRWISAWTLITGKAVPPPQTVPPTGNEYSDTRVWGAEVVLLLGAQLVSQK